MKKWQKKIEKQNLSNTFDHAKDSPFAWQMQAEYLKKAADKICWIDSEHQPIKNSDVDFLFPIYRMLLGLSFENLLKGIIIAEGNYDKANDCFDKSLSTHNVDTLLNNIHGPLNLTQAEEKLLKETENYVIWQGRYPIPKKKEMQAFNSHGTGEHRLEQALWKKLEDILTQTSLKSIESNKKA